MTLISSINFHFFFILFPGCLLRRRHALLLDSPTTAWCRGRTDAQLCVRTPPLRPPRPSLHLFHVSEGQHAVDWFYPINSMLIHYYCYSSHPFRGSSWERNCSASLFSFFLMLSGHFSWRSLFALSTPTQMFTPAHKHGDVKTRNVLLHQVWKRNVCLCLYMCSLCWSWALLRLQAKQTWLCFGARRHCYLYNPFLCGLAKVKKGRSFVFSLLPFALMFAFAI